MMRLDTVTDTWDKFGGGVASTSIASWTQVDGMTVNNGSLYVLGVFDHAGGVPAAYVTKWDGTQWCGLGIDLNTYQCRAIGTFRDTIYVSTGIIFNNDSSDNLVRWIGGNYTDTCGFLTTGIATQSQQNFIVEVLPNPATSNAIFQINGEHRMLDFIIYDQLGHEIWRKQSEEDRIELNTGEFASGLYFYRVEENGELKSSGKLIIE